jgi:sugar (pentulose or hexulose) kinase
MLDCFTNIPIQISEIAVSGGGAKSDLWCQIFADATGKVIRTLQATELGALGAAISAGVGVGIYSSVEDAVRKVVKLKREYYPNPGNHQKYQQLYRLYQSLYQHLWDDWDLRVKVVNNA